mgnify:CR=1 FL=1
MGAENIPHRRRGCLEVLDQEASGAGTAPAIECARGDYRERKEGRKWEVEAVATRPELHLDNRRVPIGFFPWRFVDGESSIGRCVAFVDDAEYEQLMERKKGMPKTKHGDCFEPAHVENLNRLTRANLGL